MIFRVATLADIPGMSAVRISVTENVLSDPGLVTEQDYREHLQVRGQGWVCDTEHMIAGFAIADLQHHNVWALFVHPAYEHMGIGRKLHDMMLGWYFSKTTATIWLSTDPKTRAASFYRKSGWQDAGLLANGELRFEMAAITWKEVNINQ